MGQERTYKFLDGGRSCGGGNYTWSLPVKNEDGSWTPGEWTEPVEGKLVPCENGYHLCRSRDLVYWIGPDLYEVETGLEVIEHDNKIVARSCRLIRHIETWNEHTARLFAVWCAREALKLIPNPDRRSITAIEVADRFANGQATNDELDAAWDAAGAAASAAAWDAAWAAAWDAAGAAAGAAASAAAGAAAGAAASAAWDAQTRKLLDMLGEG